MSLGQVLVARDNDVIVGHVQILEQEIPGVFELKSVAVCEARQSMGVGRKLVEAAVAYCRERGGRQLLVSTATADTGNLRFYQRQGFRLNRIVRDAFGPSRGYAREALIEGIPLRDQVVLDLELTP